MATYKGYLQDKNGNILLPELARDFLVTDTLTAGKIESKNKFNINGSLSDKVEYITGKTTLENGKIKATSNWANGIGTGQFIELKANTTYALSFKVDSMEVAGIGKIVIYAVSNDNNATAFKHIECYSIGNYEATFTTGDITKIWISFNGIFNSSQLQTYKYVIYDKVQIEEGFKSTNYYPYFKVLSFNEIYPIGAIYLSVNSTNPSQLFGGKWEVWGTGRVPVGVDTSQNEFNAVEKIGGSKFLQRHSHNYVKSKNFNYEIDNAGGSVYGGNTLLGAEWAVRCSTEAGGTGDSGNLQPYITCYMWKRIA